MNSSSDATGRSSSASNVNSNVVPASSSAVGDDIEALKYPLWKFVTKLDKSLIGGGNKKFRCNFCQVVYSGSYVRVRAHLLKEPGSGIKVCPKVTPIKLVELQNVVDEAQRKVQEKNVPLPTKQPNSVETPSFGTPMNIGSEYDARKRRGTSFRGSAIEKAFNLETREHLNSEIARMFYSGGLPFHFARNPHYVSAFQYAENNNLSGYIPPGYNSLRTTLLQRERAHVERLLEPIKGMWRDKGVSIVSDGWTDAQRRPLINFMAASEGGAVFIKAVNCEGEFKDKHFIANLIKDAIIEVGVERVVQVITDNAPVCKVAGALVEARYPSIFWTPCVVHTLNLALKNICAANARNEEVFEECRWISMVIDDVAFIRTFIMTHSMRLSMYNEFVQLKLLAIAETRFASMIVMLKRFKLVKRGLLNLIISEKWSCYREDDEEKAAQVKQLIMDDVWWAKIEYILEFCGPIYDMLRICDTDKPTLHLVYEMWDSIIENVKTVIYRHEGRQSEDISRFYQIVYGILIDRWTKSSTPLHCLAHSLNPRYYSNEWIDGNPGRVPPHMDVEISEEMNKCLRRYFPNNEDRRKANGEYARFSGAMDVFGSFDSLQDRWDQDPKSWWLLHGASAPTLQSVALKILSQPCSSSCCERNWSTYSFIHSMRRNKISPQRAEDLVYVHTNLRLLSRNSEHYHLGKNRMWDIGGDTFDPFEGAGVLEVANLSLDEPEIEHNLCNDEALDDDATDVLS